MKLLITLIALFMKIADTPQKEVEQAVEQLRVLMLTPDQEGLEKIAHEELTYGHSGGKVESRKEFVETLVTGKSVFRKITLKDQKIALAGNTAVVRHTLEADTFDGGVPNSIRLHIVLVWAKEKNSWKLLARQAVKLP